MVNNRGELNKSKNLSTHGCAGQVSEKVTRVTKGY